MVIDFTQPVSREALGEASPGAGVAWEALDGNRWRAVVDRKAMDPVVLTRALLGRFAVADLSLVPTPVEEIIRRLYQEGGS